MVRYDKAKITAIIILLVDFTHTQTNATKTCATHKNWYEILDEWKHLHIDTEIKLKFLSDHC